MWKKGSGSGVRDPKSEVRDPDSERSGGRGRGLQGECYFETENFAERELAFMKTKCVWTKVKKICLRF